jgi:hypothetical protein
MYISTEADGNMHRDPGEKVVEIREFLTFSTGFSTHGLLYIHRKNA